MSPCPAHAGHYTGPVYSVSQGSGVHFSPPGMTIPYGSGPEGWGGGIPGPPTVTCSGEITATFTWVPDGPGDDPPDNVIVCETARATAGGFGTVAPAVQADNGLGFPEDVTGPTPDTPYPGQWSKGAESRGTRYRVVSGEDPLVLHCSPTASSSGVGYGSAYAWYSCSAAPVTVTWGPDTGIGQQYARRYMVGLPVMAQLDPGGLQPLTRSWSIAGAGPFKSYTATTGPPPVGRKDELGQETGPSVSFYFSRQGTGTATCTVTLQVPAGAKPDNPATLTAVAHATCTVDQPTWASVGGTGVPVVGQQPNNDSFLRLLGASIAVGGGQYSGQGVFWAARVLTPEAWLAGPGYGYFSFVQLMTNSSTVTTASNPPTTYRVTTFGVPDTLDGSMPYGITLLYPPQNAPAYSGSAPIHEANDTWNVMSDAPGLDPLRPASVSAAHYVASFKSYLMYRPGYEGLGGVWVPLERVVWAMDASAANNGGVFTLMQGYTPQADSALAPVGNPEFPQWNTLADLSLVP